MSIENANFYIFYKNMCENNHYKMFSKILKIFTQNVIYEKRTKKNQISTNFHHIKKSPHNGGQHKQSKG